MKSLIMLFLATVISVANASTPTRPVMAIVGFTPGSGNEFIFRTVADRVTKNTGVNFAVINRAGAGGVVATEFVLREKADGYTIFVSSANGLAGTDKISSPTKTYTTDDFDYTLILASSPMAIIAHIDDPVSSIKQLEQTLKTEKVTFGDPGSAARIVYELLADTIKFPQGDNGVVRVDYKGPADTLNDVMGKHVRFGAVPSAVAVAAHQAGKIKIIALTGSQKNPATPEVPLMNSVYPTFVFSLDVGLVFKKGVDPERISWVEKEFKKALLDREVQQKLEENSAFVNISLQNPKQYKDHVKQMEKKLSPIVDKIVDRITNK